MLLLLVGALLLLVGAAAEARRGPPGDWRPGNLLVTGISPKPDDAGQQFVTITGVINRTDRQRTPRLPAAGRPPHQWPTIGPTIPVVYSPKNRTTGVRPAAGATAGDLT